jgi:hypothetical protein
MRCTILSILIWTISALAQTADTPLPSPTTASAITGHCQISHTTPVASPTPIEQVFPKPSQSTPENPTAESNTSPPTTTTTQELTFTAPPTLEVLDTQELTATDFQPSPSSFDDNGEAATTSQEQAGSSEQTTTSASGVSATETDSTASSGDVANGGAKGVRVGGDVAASACALVIAIAALTWVFADLD